MSDEPTATKRGRGKAAEKVEKAEKPEPKKRPKKEVAKAEGGDEDGAPQVKRGRGRPKGSTKKKTPGAKPKKGGGRRGRPKKTEESNSASEDGEENDIGEEDD